MSVSAGDHDCTTGLSGAIYDRLTGDVTSGIPSSLPAEPLARLRAMIYSFAKEIADAHNADSGGGGSGSGDVSGLTTTGVTAGLLGYFSGTLTVSKARSDGTIAQARPMGVNAGTSGSMVAGGLVTVAMTTAGGAPSVGAPVFVAAASDDAGAGAGKATATAPGAGYLVEIGLVADASAYAGSKTVDIVWQPKAPVKLS